MKKKQSTKGSIASTEQQVSRKRNTGNGTGNRQSNKHSSRSSNRETPGNISDKKAVRVKAASKAEEKEMKESHQAEISKIIRDLKEICIMVDKVEEEIQNLLCILLNDDSSDKDPVYQKRFKQRWIN